MHVNGLDAPHEKITAKIGDREYEIRWNFYAEYLLAQRGLTLSGALPEITAKSARGPVLCAEVMAASIAHHFPAGQEPTATDIAKQIQDGQFLPIWQACMKAAVAYAGSLATKNDQAPVTVPAQTAPTA